MYSASLCPSQRHTEITDAIAFHLAKDRVKEGFTKMVNILDKKGMLAPCAIIFPKCRYLRCMQNVKGILQLSSTLPLTCGQVEQWNPTWASHFITSTPILWRRVCACKCNFSMRPHRRVNSPANEGSDGLLDLAGGQTCLHWNKHTILWRQLLWITRLGSVGSATVSIQQ